MCLAVSGVDMFGLTNEVVQFLLEQLPGIENCQHYQCRYQQPTLGEVPPTDAHVDCSQVNITLCLCLHFNVVLLAVLLSLSKVCFHLASFEKSRNEAMKQEPRSCHVVINYFRHDIATVCMFIINS